MNIIVLGDYLPQYSLSMTPTDNEAKLIKIYCYVYEMYEKKSKYYCQHFSNNSNPEFTNREAITIYLYSMHVEYRFKEKHIYKFASEYL